MKRVISMILVVACLFTFSSCLKSDAAKAVDAMIEALGTITLDSLDAIEQAEKAVEELSEEDREQLDNTEMLASARAEYEAQKQAAIDAQNKAIAEGIDSKIDRIGTVTLESKEWIDHARSAYDQCDDAVKAFVTKLDVLEAAETDYDKLLAAEFEKEIDQIGEITLEKTALVHTTIEHYNALPERVKKHVHKKAMLDNALETLSMLRAKEVEDLITAIGTVTTNSGPAIEAAKTALAALSAEDAAKVSNKAVIDNALETLSMLRAKEVENLITAIGTVTPNSAPAIEAAKKAFANLSEEDAAKVSNKAVLDNIDVVYVDALIADIGKITINSKSAITKARDAYNALSYEEKNQIQNKKILDEANTKYVDACQKQGKSLLKNAWKKHDIVTGVTFYHASTMPHGSSGWYSDRRCFVLPYIVESSYGSYSMHLTNNYTGSSWVFFEKIIYSVDGKNYTDSVDYFDVTRDNSGGRVWEYINTNVGNYDIEMLWAIVNSKRTIVRFQGDDYHHDFTVSANDKAAIKDILIAYEYLTME